jgi:hypothetical protein
MNSWFRLKMNSDNSTESERAILFLVSKIKHDFMCDTPSHMIVDQLFSDLGKKILVS